EREDAASGPALHGLRWLRRHDGLLGGRGRTYVHLSRTRRSVAVRAAVLWRSPSPAQAADPREHSRQYSAEEEHEGADEDGHERPCALHAALELEQCTTERRERHDVQPREGALRLEGQAADDDRRDD